MFFRFVQNEIDSYLVDYSTADATITGKVDWIVRILPAVTIAIVIESKARDIDIFFMIPFIPQTQYRNGCKK